MKNLLFILTIASCLASCSDTDKKSDDASATKGEPLESKNSAALNQSFGKFLTSYFEVRDGLTEYDTARSNAAASKLAMLADSVELDEIRNDSTGVIKATAKDYAGTIKGSALGLAGEQEMEKKKREFQQISDAMYELVRIVKYDQEKLYHQHCPMAFGSEEAYWLSNDREIVNPYLGKSHPKYKSSMLHCGDITDSLDFAK